MLWVRGVLGEASASRVNICRFFLAMASRPATPVTRMAGAAGVGGVVSSGAVLGCGMGVGVRCDCWVWLVLVLVARVLEVLR